MMDNIPKNLGWSPYNILLKIHLVNNAEHCQAAVNGKALLCPYF